MLGPALQRVWEAQGGLCSRSNVVSEFLGDEIHAGKLAQAGQGELKVMKMKSFFFCFSNDCYC